MLSGAPGPAEGRSGIKVLSESVAAVFLAAARDYPGPLLRRDTGNGFELAPDAGSRLPLNRCFLKICSVRPGHTLVFFYKRSLLPFRRDRFSYGGCEWPDEQIGADQARASLDYLTSGLNPSARPPWLRRALTCTVPD